MTTVNILDIEATVHVDDHYATLISPEHVVELIDQIGFELIENHATLEIIGRATGEKEIRTLWRLMKIAGHEVIMD